MPTLHVVVPCYNEERTLAPCVRRVLAAPLPSGWCVAVVVVDDHSNEATRVLSEALAAGGDGGPAGARAGDARVHLLRHQVNRGKGASIRTGFAAILDRVAQDPRRRRDVVVIQDADLEYDPSDFAALLAPLLDGKADAVFGNRWGARWFADPARRTLRRRVHRAGNGVLTVASNLLTGLSVHDMECCYKLIPVELLSRVVPHLTEDRFGIEPQLAAVLGRLGARVVEVEVAYSPRSFGEGKKIGVRDAFRALWVMARERMKAI